MVIKGSGVVPPGEISECIEKKSLIRNAHLSRGADYATSLSNKGLGSEFWSKRIFQENTRNLPLKLSSIWSGLISADVIITSLLHQNDVETSIWRNNEVIIT